MSNKFLYEVRPVKPVVTPDGRAKRRPFSSLLTKEEVMEYMKSANIYRRFADTTEPIKVTGETLDALHRERFNEVTHAVANLEDPNPEVDNTPCMLDEPELEVEETTEESLEDECVSEDEEPAITTNEEDIETIDTSEEEVVKEEEESEEVEDAYEDEIEEEKPVVKEQPKQEKPANNGNKNTIQMSHGYHNKKKHH